MIMGILQRFVLFLACLSLGACATLAPSAQSGYHNQIKAKTERQLPDVELTPDIVYNILAGEIAGLQGRFDVAVKALSAASVQTRDPRLAERATHAAVYARQYLEAREVANLWVELEPRNMEAHETLAMVLLQLEKPAQAQLHLEHSLSIAKDKSKLGHTFIRLAAVLSRQGNRQAAFEVMQTLTKQHPETPYALMALANLAVRAGEMDPALESINRALDLQPDWIEAALFKGRILIARKNNGETKTFFKEYLDTYPDSAKVRLNYARFLVDSKQWRLAKEEFEHVVSHSPKDADSIFAVGLLSFQSEQLEQAEQYFRRHLKLRSDNDQARIYLGQIAQRQKRYSEALTWFKEITSSEQYFEAQTRMAMVMAKMGNVEQARQHIHKIHPESDEQRVQLVLAEEQVLRESKQYQEAMNVLNKALKETPDDTDILYARALIAEKLDLIEITERDLRKILKKDPKNTHALNALGYTLADRTDRADEAYKLVSLAMKEKPNDAFILDSMGWVEYRRGNYQEAIKHLKKALTLRDDAEIFAHLGEVLWMVGERNKAMNIWKQALEKTPDNEALLGTMKRFVE